MNPHPIAQKVAGSYGNVFGGEHIVVRSPGRVNIIGEHTDYNEGFVLPAAINKAAFVAVGKREDQLIRLFSVAYNESFEINIANLQPSDKGWPNYVLGVVDQMIKRSHNVQGFNLVLDADIPIGAGMSSSAAVECATAYALDSLFNLAIPRLEMAFIAQKAEHTFAGVMCGIMDQFASLFGKKGHVLKLDCRSMEYEYAPFDLVDTSIVLLNTNVEHSLAGSEYNIRRQQCEEGAAMVKTHIQQVNSLRDVDMAMLEKYVRPVNEEIFRRCKYVVEENERLLKGFYFLEHGDIKSLGKQMFASHHGLSTEYNVSCRELDFLVDQVKGNEAVPGARMMGGGFGGCTINLVKNDQIETLIEDISTAYEKSMGRKLTSYIALTEDGTSLLNL